MLGYYNGCQIGNFTFYSLIVFMIIISLVFYSIYILLNQAVLDKTSELTMSNTLIESILDSHDEMVILIHDNDTIKSNKIYKEYIQHNSSIQDILTKNSININDGLLLRSHKVVDGHHTFLLNKKNIDINSKVYTLLTLTDISDFDKHLEYIKSKVYVDSLTSLNNRALFEHILHDLIMLGEIKQQAFALIMCDIDYFKNVNDTYGHNEGDKVLKDVANFISKHIRDDDMLFRWGGDEFFLIITGESSHKAYDISEKLRSKFEKSDISSKYLITISFGLTAYIIGDTIQTITSRADKALYISKEDGRNRSTIK